MRRLVWFFVAAAAVFALLIGFVRRTDPFGEFYDVPLASNLARAQPCLVADSLVGDPSRAPFKLDLVARRHASTVVVGISRTFEIGARPGETSFVNAGVPDFGTATLAPMFRALHARRPGKLTVYVGVELFWLNRSWKPRAIISASLGSRLRYLTARANLVAGAQLAWDHPEILVRRARRYDVGGHCVLDRAPIVAHARANAWAPDGTLRYAFQLLPATRKPPDDDYTRDLVRFESEYYRDWTELAPERLRELDDALELARSYGWTVVGFTSPYASRWVARFEQAPQTAARWREFGQVVPEIFRRNGYPYLDLRDVRDVPCGETQFVDDGWHPDPACARVIRRRLDAAAG
jgi:hypothetical protein